MSVIFLLIPLSIVIAACFLGAFIWAVKTGQYEDTCTPSMRVLLEDMGRTGYQPVPSGDSPDGMEKRLEIGTASGSIRVIPHSARQVAERDGLVARSTRISSQNHSSNHER